MKDPHEMRTGNRYAREAEERRTLGDLIAIANPAFAMGLLVALDQSHEAVEKEPRHVELILDVECLLQFVGVPTHFNCRGSYTHWRHQEQLAVSRACSSRVYATPIHAIVCPSFANRPIVGQE